MEASKKESIEKEVLELEKKLEELKIQLAMILRMEAMSVDTGEQAAFYILKSEIAAEVTSGIERLLELSELLESE